MLKLIRDDKMKQINKKKLTKIVFELIILLLFLIILNLYDNEKIIVKLSSCVDGDTAKFVIDNETKTVRFLAIDTPESVHPTIEDEEFGYDASEYTCEILKKAKIITLEFDINSDKYDKYDRLLAWIFIDDVLLQNELIKIGYAEVAYLYGDYKYTDMLKKTEAIAKEKNLGIWYNGNWYLRSW